MKTKSALSYFGSDSEVAGELAGMLNHCHHVTIPFCGGMSILPHLTARAIVANDLNDLAINFYRHATSPVHQHKLFERCDRTLSHPSELELALSELGEENQWTRMQAWAYWAMCWIGRKGKGGTDSEGQGLQSIRWTASGGTNASRIRAAADDLPAWAKHFERCEWLCEDFRTVLGKVKDQDGCGVYCDPPFYGAGDAYIHSFSEKDHADLAECLSRFEQTTVVVRYGDDRLIRDLYGSPQFTIIEAESRTQSNAIKGELWITNKTT